MKTNRENALVVAVLALVWIGFPSIHMQGTEMAFPAGSPDPNVYKITYLYGWPLSWLSWERSWNDAAGYDESGFRSLDVTYCLIHVSVIAAPVLLFIRATRLASRDPSANVDGAG